MRESVLSFGVLMGKLRCLQFWQLHVRLGLQLQIGAAQASRQSSDPVPLSHRSHWVHSLNTSMLRQVRCNAQRCLDSLNPHAERLKHTLNVCTQPSHVSAPITADAAWQALAALALRIADLLV